MVYCQCKYVGCGCSEPVVNDCGKNCGFDEIPITTAIDLLGIIKSTFRKIFHNLKRLP
jgi:hypothetical protein